MSPPVAVDLFAGGGGASLGIAQALGRAPIVAINHNAGALRMHALNHPKTLHIAEDVFKAQPWRVLQEYGIRPVIDLLWLSPDCTHHSRAKGSAPVDSGRRSLAWVALDWIRACAPQVICLENVPEFEHWGPLDDDGKRIKERAGEDFQEFVGAMRLHGYRVEWRCLRGCDFGAPTIRNRLFLVARRDGQPIVWPEPTHGPGLLPYRTAAECIDWSVPCHSLFLSPEEARAVGVRRPLADATMRRVAEGVRRYVLEAADPFLINTRNGERQGQTPRVRPLDEPLPTITARGSQGGLVVPSLLNLSHGGRVEGLQQPFRTLTATPAGGDRALVSACLTQHNTRSVGADLDAPMPTATGRAKQGLISAFLAKHYGGPTGHATPGQDLRDPMATITSRGQLGPVQVDLGGADLGRAQAVAAFLVQYYGSGGQDASLSEPMRTIVTRARHGLVTVDLEGEPWVVADIKLRMLTPRELARGMGFPDSYELLGTKAEQISRIGNSVCPQVVEALVRSQFGRWPAAAA